MNKTGQAQARQSRFWIHCCFAVLFTLLSSCEPLAFSAKAGAATTDASPGRIKRSAALDPFFRGPASLKVILDPRNDHAIMSVPIPGRISFINHLEKDTGARIQLSCRGDWYQDSGYFAKVLTISGEAASVLQAFSRVRPNDDREMIITFLVPTSAGGLLIGSAGNCISEAERQTGTTIRIIDVPNREENTVSVKGKTRDIDAVVRWLLDQQAAYNEVARRDTRSLLTLKYGPEKSDSSSEIFMKLSEKQARWLTGKGGSNIKKLQQMFYVYLDFEQRTDQSSMLRVKGCLGDVEAAHRFILHAISKVQAGS